MFMYFFNGSHSYLGNVLVSYFFLKIEKKVKRGRGGEGEEKVVKNIWVTGSKDDLWYKVFTEWTRGSEGVL